MILAAHSPVAEPSRPDGTSEAQRVRDGLDRAAEAIRALGVPVPELGGGLLRPLLAYLFVPADKRDELDDRFWLGALAIQMVHEASLIHDDIVDEARHRRGAPTINATRGVGPALITGDHYLTGAYRAALATGSPDFVHRFIVAVERTVAGEVRQARQAGSATDLGTYFEIVLGKSGELMGIAGALGATLLGLDDVQERASLGRQVGALYQQIDDLLDYCGGADTGKDPLQDYRQRKWTWVLEIAGVDSFDLTDHEVLDAVFGQEPYGISSAERAVRALEVRRGGLVRALARAGVSDPSLARLLGTWIATTREAVGLEVARRTTPHTAVARRAEEQVAVAATALGDPAIWPRYFKTHARTFSLAARLFPSVQRRSVAALYAFCRFTDDLVDDPSPGDPVDVARRLEAWTRLSRRAFEGEPTGVPVLDHVMADARSAGVAWRYPEALLAGSAMDLEPTRYVEWVDLRLYTYRVAGAVGGWLSQLFGLRDPELLERAHALGHAMQLTNVLRDVGEDLGRRRVYLPQSLLDEHDLTVAELDMARAGLAPLPRTWPSAMEELMARADEQYSFAHEGIRALPPALRRPVAAAAEAYRGIHDEVRRNDYDNLRKRAHTSLATKVRLGFVGVVRSSRWWEPPEARAPFGRMAS